MNNLIGWYKIIKKGGKMKDTDNTIKTEVIDEYNEKYSTLVSLYNKTVKNIKKKKILTETCKKLKKFAPLILYTDIKMKDEVKALVPSIEELDEMSKRLIK